MCIFVAGGGHFMKLLLTGDLHLGRAYQKENPEVAQKFSEARIVALRNAVGIANREKCELFVIAGDLYDKVSGIPQALHKEVCRVLSEFEGQAVLILPGNHDYYDPEHDVLWKNFEEFSCSHIRVLKHCEPYRLDGVTFYPCPCHSKHSKENALGWMKNALNLDSTTIQIGIAHGAVRGYSLDANQDYYHMTEQELLGMGMDLWLIGHTHVEFSIGNRIFNAGTPQQTDIADNSKSEVYLIEVDEKRKIAAKKEKTGMIDFVKKDIILERGQRLEDVLHFPELNAGRTSLRVSLSGVVTPEEYETRQTTYETCGQGFIKFEVKDEALKKTITPELINQETLEGTAINQLLNGYADDPELLDIAYAVVLECREEKR